MPVNSTHPAYAENAESWRECRDAYAGERAIKSAGEAYLPRLSGQTNAEYAAYVKRGLYYGAVGRSIDGFVGAIVRKPPVVKLPPALDVFETDTTASGIGLVEYIKKLAGEDLITGRAGILVDFDEAKNRSYLSTFTAESITNWGDGFIVLKEKTLVQDGADRFALKAIDQYRELLLENGQYVVNIWRKTGGQVGKDEWQIHETIRPNKRGVPRKEIPFFWLSCFGRSEKIEKPPLQGLVSVALSHYRSSVDLEHGRHFCGMPTLYVTGAQATDSPLRIGASTAIQLTDPAAKVGYAEFTGQGLGSLERALESKEHMMAVLGAAVFADQKKGVEAAETARIRTSGQDSLLMGVVNAVEETLEAALREAGEWMGAPVDSIDININRDFIDTTLDPQTLAALLDSYLKGAITLDTFLFNLKQAEMIDPDRSIEEEKAGIKANPPPSADDSLPVKSKKSKPQT